MINWQDTHNQTSVAFEQFQFSLLLLFPFTDFYERFHFLPVFCVTAAVSYYVFRRNFERARPARIDPLAHAQRLTAMLRKLLLTSLTNTSLCPLAACWLSLSWLCSLITSWAALRRWSSATSNSASSRLTRCSNSRDKSNGMPPSESFNAWTCVLSSRFSSSSLATCSMDTIIKYFSSSNSLWLSSLNLMRKMSLSFNQIHSYRAQIGIYVNI